MCGTREALILLSIVCGFLKPLQGDPIPQSAKENPKSEPICGCNPALIEEIVSAQVSKELKKFIQDILDITSEDDYQNNQQIKKKGSNNYKKWYYERPVWVV